MIILQISLNAIVVPVPVFYGGVIGGVILIGGLIIGIVYYNHKAKAVKEFDENDYCHVKYTKVSNGWTVTCEGRPCEKGACNLYTRLKGTEARWKRIEKDLVDAPRYEYRCFCQDPNRP